MRIPTIIGVGVAAVLLIGVLLFRHARGSTNDVALSSLPKGVTAVRAVAASYRPTRRYVGTLEPWISARVGPQLVSAYVDTVLVRPGAVVKRGEVVATLDCRNADAQSRAVAMQARAIDAQQKAIADESARVHDLRGGGFVSPNEAEQKEAQSSARAADLLATQ